MPRYDANIDISFYICMRLYFKKCHRSRYFNYQDIFCDDDLVDKREITVDVTEYLDLT